MNVTFSLDNCDRGTGGAERFRGETIYRTFADCVHKTVGIPL